MVTHFHVGTNRPTKRLNLHVSSVSPLPKSYRDAFNDPNWQNAMRDEYTALIKNKTWTLVPRPSDTNIVRCMWLFRHKHLANGTLSHYKARLVANGSTQLEGVDVAETFSPVVKPGTIQTVLSLATSRHWPIHELNVKNAFLHGELSETVYMYQPLRFRESAHHDYGIDISYLLLYVDDIVLTAFSEGIYVTRDSSGLFLSQKKYAIEILEKAHMVSYNPIQQVCLHMHDPREPHLSALKRILRYVQGTLNYGLQLFSSSTSDLVAYSDADWAGCPTTRRLTSRNLLRELHTPLSSATLVYCDNVSAVYLSCNPVQRQRTKHIEIDIHFVRDLVATGQVRVLHVPSRYQFTDIII
ncbi:ribonuclease H-like domain-containing protein [Tanacetum coccineum]